MSDATNNRKPLDEYINQQILKNLESNKLALINENIIKTLDLENREKLLITEIRKLLKKQKVDFFYMDEIIKRITSKYKTKEDPKKYLVSLYQKGVIVKHKRKESIFTAPTSIISDTSELEAQGQEMKEPESTDLYKEREKLEQKILSDLETTELPTIGFKDRVSEESTEINKKKVEMEQEIPIPIQSHQTIEPTIENKPNLLKNIPEPAEKPITKVEISSKPIQTTPDKPKAETLLEKPTREQQISTIQAKETITDEEKRILLKFRKEMIENVQTLLNQFKFLDAIAELEQVIDISKKIGDQKAVELYTKQSEDILQTGLKYESIIDNIKANPVYKKKVEDTLQETINQIRKLWKSKDYKSVYAALRKAAKLSYYLEKIDDAVIFNEQAESIKNKIKG